MEEIENGEKILGYDKKLIIRYAVWVAIALVAFYAGAKYEKNKLERLHLLKSSASQDSQNSGDGTSKKSKKAKTETVMPPTDAKTGTDSTTPTTGTVKPGQTAPTTMAPKTAPQPKPTGY